MNISNLPKAVCFHVTSFNHLNKRIKDSCYIPNFTVKESGSEKSVIAQSWDGKPGATPASNTGFVHNDTVSQVHGG